MEAHFENRNQCFHLTYSQLLIFFEMRKDKGAFLSLVGTRTVQYGRQNEKNLVHLHDESVRHGRALRGSRLEII